MLDGQLRLVVELGPVLAGQVLDLLIDRPGPDGVAAGGHPLVPDEEAEVGVAAIGQVGDSVELALAEVITGEELGREVDGIEIEALEVTSLFEHADEDRALGLAGRGRAGDIAAVRLLRAESAGRP